MSFRFPTPEERVVYYLNELIAYSPFTSTITAWVGVYTVYAVPLFLVILWLRGLKDLALRAFSAGILGWLGISNIIGAIYFRSRPEITEVHGPEVLFHRPTYSFPSDHATLFAALVTTFYLFGYKRLAFWTGVVGLLVSAARVALGFHYPTDILGGIVVGGGTAWALWRMQKPVGRFLVQPLIRLAGYLRL